MPLKRRTHKKKPTGNGMVSLIDADIILYQATAVCDVVSYTCNGSVPFKYKKDMVAHCHDMNYPVEAIEKHVTPEPLSFCLHTIKSMIHNIMDKTGADSARLFLTGKGNYRETIDSIAPYKGNRPTEKPTHFEAARKYLIEKFDAEVVEGIEADDAMGVAQYDYWNELLPDTELNKAEAKTVICTLDKDLNMIPGWHYNWTKDEKYWVGEDEADLFFYTQLLTGDNVDNIKGIKGVGAKTAEKILDALKEEDTYTLKGMCSECLYQYESAGMDYYDMLENGNLLWIQREKDKHWNPPL